jgi:IS5 family transposase
MEIKMRLLKTVWNKVTNIFAKNEEGQEIEGMSQWLDSRPEILEWVAEDLGSKELKATGRHGMSVETVLRAGILKQAWQVSYKRLSFHMEDSMSCRAFVRLDSDLTPKKSALQIGISAIRDTTWERINRCMLKDASSERIENGRKVRVDSTPTESNIHHPNDSALLYDSIRVMGRLLENCQSTWGFIKYHTHSKPAKQLARKVLYAKKASQKEVHYKKLVVLAKDNLKSLNNAGLYLAKRHIDGPDYNAWCAQVSNYRPLVEGVISQTSIRVFNDEKVPVSEKVVSLFEPHTDIIVKDNREVYFGHKLNLTSGKSSMILDIVIEPGNPADSERFLPMIENHIGTYGCPPQKITADGSYASKDNLKKAKDEGIKDVVFHKKRGLETEYMAKSDWVGPRRLCPSQATL